MTHDLGKYVGLRKFDWAVPQGWLDEVTKLGVKAQFVWDYSDEKRSWGVPVAIREMAFEELARRVEHEFTAAYVHAVIDDGGEEEGNKAAKILAEIYRRLWMDKEEYDKLVEAAKHAK